ncbi:uncharacterized protein L3040_003299 [Drepanopeziza brunnea f. sp. 'multigermtubi']|uniref:uncharacterized protein n=1 Tax=Drepanopeziza brunnea f. sp. 'multigermtubi' TaxID=698441 RepID=UPI002394E2B1|nr:hypothetical protein L3040_003299 [Drepanopeziza brunnea f. sp. 'multigermtubi']
MMFINNIVVAAILAASTVTARNITLCEDPNFVSCRYPEAPVGLCVILPITTDTASSLDTGGAPCEFFVDSMCLLASGSFNYTGRIAELGVEPGLELFDDKISSFSCQ